MSSDGNAIGIRRCAGGRRVVENLLSNALKFAPPGTRVDVATEEGNPGGVRVRVLDRGPGIDPADASGCSAIRA